MRNLFQLSAVCTTCGDISGVCKWEHDGKVLSLCYSCAAKCQSCAGSGKETQEYACGECAGAGKV
jgi:hypothetical protein